MTNNPVERPELPVLIYDPRENKGRSAIFDFFEQQPDTVCRFALSPENALREMQRDPPYVLCINTTAQGAGYLLAGLAKTNLDRKPSLICIGTGESIDTLAQKYLEEPIHPPVKELSKRFMIQYVRRRKNYLAVLRPVLDDAMRNARKDYLLAGPETQNTIALEDLLPITRQGELALTLAGTYQDLQNQLVECEEEKKARLKTRMESALQHCGRLLARVLESPDTEGKERFTDEVTELGGTGWSYIFLKQRDPHGAKHYCDILRFLTGTGALRVPGKPPQLLDYAVLPVAGSAITTVPTIKIPGPNYRNLLRECEAASKSTSTDLSAECTRFAPLLRDVLISNSLNDLAVFERLMRESPLGPGMCTPHLKRSLVEYYIGNLMLVPRAIDCHAPGTIVQHSDTLATAIKALDPLDRDAIRGKTLAITDKTLLAHRDCKPGNMSLEWTEREIEGEYLPSIFKHIKSAAQRSANRHPGDKKADDGIEKELRRLVGERTVHYDFSCRRPGPALWGEDFFQMLLYPEALGNVEDHDLVVENERGDERILNFLYQYAVAGVLASKNKNFTHERNENERNLDEGVEIQQQLHQLLAYKRGERKSHSWFTFRRGDEERPFLATNIRKRAEEYIAQYRCNSPAQYAYHLDWLHYYRCMRDTFLALGVKQNDAHIIPDFSKEFDVKKVGHYLKQSILPLDAIYKRFWDELPHARRKCLHEDCRYVTPDSINVQETIESMLFIKNKFENAAASERPFAEDLFMHRVRCLIALSRHYLQCLGLEDRYARTEDKTE